MKKIGFIGLGAMGSPMAKNLLRNKFSVTVYDICSDRIKTLADAGATAANSPAEAASGAEMIITMLPSSPDVEQAVCGPEGVLKGIGEGAVYVDMSTIDPITTRRIGDIMAERGVAMLDCPVTKGVKAAVDGTLTLLIGGEKSVLESVRHVLQTMGSTLMHLGPLGAGATTKLVNNMCLGAIVAATAEAMVFGAKLGMDMDALVEAVASGSGSSRALITHIKEFALARRFDVPMFPVHLLMKDLELAINTAKEVNMPLMMTPFCHSLYALSKAKGGGKGFFPELITVFEEFAGVEAVLPSGLK